MRDVDHLKTFGNLRKCHHFILRFLFEFGLKQPKFVLQNLLSTLKLSNHVLVMKTEKWIAKHNKIIWDPIFLNYNP